MCFMTVAKGGTQCSLSVAYDEQPGQRASGPPTHPKAGKAAWWGGQAGGRQNGAVRGKNREEPVAD